jgi:hypothetical protein
VTSGNTGDTKQTTTVPYRPLGLVKEVVDTMGLQITHTYEDLVFIEHNAFLLQMGERSEDVYLYFNIESAVEMREEITGHLSRAGRPLNLKIRRHGIFRMTQEDDGENIQLEFLEEE